MSRHRPGDLWVMGDVHGALDKLRALLLRAGLIDFGGGWTGGRAHLAFLGDYLDRGPDGLGVVRLVRRLEEEAPRAGGRVTALLGNHEVMFLAATHFRGQDPGDRLGFWSYWTSNGGQMRDAGGLEDADAAWLRARPALARVGPWLLMHADSRMYLKFGGSVETVNGRVAGLLGSADPDVWGRFANAFASRFAFASGEGAAQGLLRVYGAERLAHGHTPVYVLLDEVLHARARPGLPLTYASGRCVALDSALAYREGAGFLTRLDDRGVAEYVLFAPERRPS